MVHNDVKPDNILLRDDVHGDVVVADFGQASSSGFPASVGDPRYAPPQAWQGVDLKAVGSLRCPSWLSEHLFPNGLTSFCEERSDAIIK